MILLSLILAAAPPVLLEPDAGGAHRLHPRRVTASTFLENGWNKHAQNYLPLYVADDDPATAWVEGAKGRGEGEALEWWGPSLTRAKVFRVFVRNGYQKSEKLYRANARPRKVKLEPLVQGETGPQTTGAPVEAELRDVLGWQEVRVPVPERVGGVRLTLVSTYPGATYDDTCLSDLRVYVEGEDPYKAEAETAAFEQVRAYAYERKMAAARNDTKAKVEWAPRYKVETLFEKDFTEKEMLSRPGGVMSVAASDFLATVPEKPAYKAALARARQMAAEFDRVDLNRAGTDSEARGTWTRVKPAQLRPQKAAASAALSAMEDPGLVRVAGLLHLADTTFFEADTTQAQMKARIQKALAQEGRELVACEKRCEKERREAPAESDFTCEEECSGVFSELSGSKSELLEHRASGGEFLQGPLDKPTAFLRGTSEASGNREVWLTFRQTLITYKDQRADSVVVYGNMQGSDDPVFFYVLEWSEKAGKSRLESITAIVVNAQAARVLRYRPASNA
ncbi:NADase-type glycan-binding domain-containing protein [Myxococcus faecalis]|uniref:NADase-type glycan-binding domain-containing protein n=1 Tax=Myxococcus faecalis TaxID=3115646 RepID=UPI0038D0D654